MSINVSRYAQDMAERAASTFGEAFLAYLGARSSNFSAFAHVPIWKGAVGAGAAAVLALGKGLVAGHVGDQKTAALLPAAAGGAAGAAVGAAAGSAVGSVLGSVEDAVGNIVKDVEQGKGTSK